MKTTYNFFVNIDEQLKKITNVDGESYFPNLYTKKFLFKLIYNMVEYNFDAKINKINDFIGSSCEKSENTLKEKQISGGSNDRPKII